jgi:hypothetical protein
MTQRILVPALTTLVILFKIGAHVPLAQETQEPPKKHPQIAKLEAQIAGKERLPAEEVWKNIQTFKGRPAIAVLRVMEQAFVPNLGVKCNYCHVPGQWELDDKNPKKVARQMWVMRAKWQEEARTASGNPEAVVTCYTCHKGKPKPAFAPEK